MKKNQKILIALVLIAISAFAAGKNFLAIVPTFDSTWYLNTAGSSIPSCTTQVGGVSSVTFNGGAITTSQSNPATTNYLNCYYATAQKGEFPWQPSPPVGSGGALQSDVSNISLSLSFVSRGALTTPSRYHIYIGLYYLLNNGTPMYGCNNAYPADDSYSLSCSTRPLFAWIDTQFRFAENINGVNSPVATTDVYNPGDSFGFDQVIAQLNPGQNFQLTGFDVKQDFLNAAKAWNIPATTQYQLKGMEVGLEGYDFSGLVVNWNNIGFNIIGYNAPSTSVDYTLYIVLAVVAVVAAISIYTYTHRRKRKPRFF